MKPGAAILSIGLALQVSAQPMFGIQWSRTFGGSLSDQARGACVVPGGFALAGTSNSNDGLALGGHGLQDAWVLGLSDDGAVVWQRLIGGSGNDRGCAIMAMPDGGCVIAGETQSNDGDVSGHHGMADFLVARLDSLGSIVWLRALGGSGSDVANAVSMAANGDVLVAGSTRSVDGDVSGLHGDGTTSDMWVARLSADGQLLWRAAVGGSLTDVAWALCAMPDGGMLVVGESDSQDGDVVGAHGLKDACACRLGPTGELLWCRALGGSLEDMAYGAFATPDGGAVLVGESRSGDGDVFGGHGAYDAWVLRLSNSGGVMWQRMLGGSQNDRFNAIAGLSGGRYLLAGSTYSLNGNVTGQHGSEDCWLVLVDAGGGLLWERCFGGTQVERAFAVSSDPLGGTLFAGYTTSSNGDVEQNAGLSDTWAVRLDDFTQMAETRKESFADTQNPARGEAFIMLPHNGPAECRISDTRGRIAGEFLLQGPEDRLSVEQLAPGAYVVRVSTGTSAYGQLLIIE